MSLPNFIVIGPGKTGTSWLYECLREHPEVCLAKNIKETLFFIDNFDKGNGWYEQFFSDCPRNTVRGEMSNTYFFSPEVPLRVKTVVAEVKLVACLRNPIERLYSLYLFRLRNGLVKGSFEEVIGKDPTMVEQNFYHRHLSRWLDYFPRSQIHIALFDDLENCPRKFLGEILAFLGVDVEFEPSVLNERVLPASRPRNPLLFHFVKRIGLAARSHELFKLLTWAKRSNLLNTLLLRPHDMAHREAIEAETRLRLHGVYEDEIQKVSKLLGRDLSAWG